jgi:DNA-binding response OmpR family regulator
VLRVVVIEDHDALRELLVGHLRRRGHEVFAAADAEALDHELAGVRADVYLLDVNLPGEDGLALATRLRSAEPTAGLVVLTGRTGLADRVRGYDCGADVYLAKPVDVAELDAVLRSLARRIRGDGALEFVLLVDNGTLRGPAASVRLSAPQVALLAALARAPGGQLATFQIMERLGRSPDSYRESTLQVAVARLRERIVAAGGARRAIVAIRGEGYALRTLIRVVQSGQSSPTGAPLRTDA